MRTRLMWILLDPSPAEGGGGGGTAATPPAAPDYAAALAKSGNDAGAFAMAQFTEAANLRRQLAEVSGKVPKDGSRVLSAEEAARFDAWAQLGPPEELGQALEQGRTAVGRVKAFDRQKLIGQAAAAYDWSPEVLGHLAGADLAIEVKDAQRPGKPAKVAEVVTSAKGADGKETVERTPLDKYAEKHWASFAASLAGKQAAPALGTPSANQPIRTTAAASQPAAPRRSIF